MEILRTVAHSLQHLFGPELKELAAGTNVIERKRKFDAVTLLRTLVLTVLKHPQAKPTDFQTTAAQLGVHVSKAAIRKRFSDKLVAFLRAVLEQAMTMALAVEPTTRDLLQNFTAVFLGDATSLRLPDF